MFKVLRTDTKSRARLGVLETEHGIVETPSYVIVGTHGSVRCLGPQDLRDSKTQLIISNTYHLWRSWGEEGLQHFPGLHELMQWSGPIMTDSGGFQVFSLGFLREYGMRRGGTVSGQQRDPGQNWVRITPSGVYFRATDQGKEEESYLDAELSIKIQEQLGADIIVAFDEPTSPAADAKYSRQAMERTHAWALRSLEVKYSKQVLYGVVQGGAFEDLREESASYIGNLPFDGIAIGSTYGDSYGGTKAKTADMLAWTIPYLPENKPRHLFGIGQINDIFAGVEAGIDTFDCVIPTREARHGRLWTSEGHIDITKGSYSNDSGVIDQNCNCPVCLGSNVDRAGLHDLFKQKNPEAGHLATLHNVYFFNDLMEKIRDSIRENTFSRLKKEILGNTKRR